MAVVGQRPSPEGPPRSLLYYDQRDGSFWDYSYDTQPPYEPFGPSNSAGSG